MFYGINLTICKSLFFAEDAGKSMIVHTFGAYFGLAASFFF